MSTDLDVRPRARFVTPRMEIALVGGFFPPGNKRRWYLVDSAGGASVVLRHVRLFAFNLLGYEQAMAAARRVRDATLPNAVAFTARVLVIGRGTPGEEIVEAWRLEGPEPVDLGRYSFQ